MALYYDDFGSRDSKDLGLDASAIEIFLDPGEYFVGDASFQVRTLLGSCVSIILWHPRMRFGAMCHFLLGTRTSGAGGTEQVAAPDVQGKYADEVMELMMRELRLAGVPVEQCHAKVFGGGNMFPDQTISKRMNIGEKNSEAARHLLAAHSLPIMAEDVCGNGHREVIFNVGNGDVWVRQVRLESTAGKRETLADGHF